MAEQGERTSRNRSSASAGGARTALVVGVALVAAAAAVAGVGGALGTAALLALVGVVAWLAAAYRAAMRVRERTVLALTTVHEFGACDLDTVAGIDGAWLAQRTADLEALGFTRLFDGEDLTAARVHPGQRAPFRLMTSADHTARALVAQVLSPRDAVRLVEISSTFVDGAAVLTSDASPARNPFPPPPWVDRAQLPGTGVAALWEAHRERVGGRAGVALPDEAAWRAHARAEQERTVAWRREVGVDVADAVRRIGTATGRAGTGALVAFFVERADRKERRARSRPSTSSPSGAPVGAAPPPER